MTSPYSRSKFLFTYFYFIIEATTSRSADTEAGADEPIILNDNKSKKTKGIRQKKRKTTEKSPSLRCRICARRNFSNENSLKVHMKTHGIDKKHQCSVCNKHFKTAVILTGAYSELITRRTKQFFNHFFPL